MVQYSDYVLLGRISGSSVDKEDEIVDDPNPKGQVRIDIYSLSGQIMHERVKTKQRTSKKR